MRARVFMSAYHIASDIDCFPAQSLAFLSICSLFSLEDSSIRPTDRDIQSTPNKVLEERKSDDQHFITK